MRKTWKKTTTVLGYISYSLPSAEFQTTIHFLQFGIWYTQCGVPTISGPQHTQTISIFCKSHTLIGTSPCVWYTWRAGVLYSNWNVLPRLTRASIMFLWRPSSDFLSAPQFRLLCPSLHPAVRNSSNDLLYLIYDISREKNVNPITTKYVTNINQTRSSECSPCQGG